VPNVARPYIAALPGLCPDLVRRPCNYYKTPCKTGRQNPTSLKFFVVPLLCRKTLVMRVSKSFVSNDIASILIDTVLVARCSDVFSTRHFACNFSLACILIGNLSSDQYITLIEKETQMSNVIVGLFNSPEQAASAIYTLELRGVPANTINLVASDGFNKDSFAVDSHSKFPEGVALGATTGAAITALVAGFTAVGAVVTGGASLLVSGPAVAALAGAGAGAAGGGIIGGLIGAAVPEHEVKFYEDALEKGSVLIGVEHTDDNKKLVKETLEVCNAEKVTTA